MIHRRISRFLVVLTLLVISCDVSILLPASTTNPTPYPGAVDTIVASTAGAASTQTAQLIPPSLTPTSTPTASRTPTNTATFTPTFVFIFRLPTNTRVPVSTTTPGGSSSQLNCKLLSQTPADGTHFAPKKNFSANWKVKNTGSNSWEAGSVDFAYFSGTKMFKIAVHDLPASVEPGDNTTLSAGMVAPNANGTYTTVWTLRQGTKDFCHVDLTIVVP